MTRISLETHSRNCWFIVLGWLLFCGTALAQPTGQRPLNVLLLSSYSQDYPSAVELQEGLNTVLNYRGGANNLYVEYFDSARIPDEYASRHFAEHLGAKYQDTHFDHVLVWHLSAVNFIEQNPDLFPGSKLIYFEGPELTADEVPAGADWFNVPQDFDASLAEVDRLYAPEKLFVILDLNDINGQSRLENFQRAHASLMPSVEVEYLIDQSLPQIDERLRQPQAVKTAAIYLLTFKDAEGKPTAPRQAYIWLAQRSEVPIFSFWQTLMGSGLVGGRVFSHWQAGRSLGNAILASAGTNSTQALETHLLTYDWSLMKRWDIDTDLIPDNALVINKPDNLLYTYRWYLAVIAVVMLMLSTLSASLARTLVSRNAALGALRYERLVLEDKVAVRTRELAGANDVLNQRNAELLQTISENKTLKGFIPICSYCKHVRHDEGYWQQVETYVSSQTEAQFSHSICPTCVETHHGDLMVDVLGACAANAFSSSGTLVTPPPQSATPTRHPHR